MPTRREFLKWTVASGAGLAVGGWLSNGADWPASTARAAAVWAARGLTPYVDPMPTLTDNAIDATGGGTVDLTTRLITRKVHRDLPATTLFG